MSECIEIGVISEVRADRARVKIGDMGSGRAKQDANCFASVRKRVSEHIGTMRAMVTLAPQGKRI